MGACPDEMDSSGSCTNDVSDVSGWKENGQQCVVFTRRFATGEHRIGLSLYFSKIHLCITSRPALNEIIVEHAGM